MGRKSVAVLDIRSSEVAVFIGERGVNHTFVFKASRTEAYDGYENGAFYDTDKLAEAIVRAITGVEQICGERIRQLYIGVPGEFCEVVTRQQDIGFSKKRKITQRDLDALMTSGREELAGCTFMRATSMVYVTADNRRVVDPVGFSSTGLTGALSYFYCKNYFRTTMEKIFADMKISLKYLPTQYAMGSYLVPSETRDECALFVDAGFLSSTVSILLGNGVLVQETFWAGKGQIAVLLMEKFSLPYEAALALVGKANLFSKNEVGKTEFIYRGVAYEYSPEELAETVRVGLDSICERVSAFLEVNTDRELDYKPLYITGEGISEIRGAVEHVSKRLNRICEVLVPNLPYYNKPAMSSRIALADMAYDDNCNDSFLRRILNGFGG